MKTTGIQDKDIPLFVEAQPRVLEVTTSMCRVFLLQYVDVDGSACSVKSTEADSIINTAVNLQYALGGALVLGDSLTNFVTRYDPTGIVMSSLDHIRASALRGNDSTLVAPSPAVVAQVLERIERLSVQPVRQEEHDDDDTDASELDTITGSDVIAAVHAETEDETIIKGMWDALDERDVGTARWAVAGLVIKVFGKLLGIRDGKRDSKAIGEPIIEPAE